jgi:hypothetical protein
MGQDGTAARGKIHHVHATKPLANLEVGVIARWLALTPWAVFATV